MWSLPLRSGAAFWRRLPEYRRRPSASNGGARADGGAPLVAGYAEDISDMALTDGKVGYMLGGPALDVGETVLPECPELGDCCEYAETTLEAGVRAGVSVVAGAGIDATAVACEDCGCAACIPGGEWLDL